MRLAFLEFTHAEVSQRMHGVVATALCRRAGGHRAERLDTARRLQ